MLPVETIIYFIVQIFIYLFHLSVLAVLFFRRHSAFKGPFYTILRIVFLVDVIWFLVITTIQKISLIPAFIPFYKESFIFASFCFNASAYLSMIQFGGHVLMALNRFTLIWFPLKHKSLWESRWYIFVLFLLPLLNIIWRIHQPTHFVYLSEISVAATISNPEISAPAVLALTIIYLSTTFIAAVLNILAFIKFYFHKQIASIITVNERHLLVMSLITMVAQMLRASYNLSRVIFPSDAGITLFYNAALLPLADIFALSGSVSLLVLSATTRKEYRIFYFGKSLQNVIAISSSHKAAHTRQNK